RESLECDVAVAVVFISDHVKIVLPACDRQVGTPPILDLVVFNVSTRLKLTNLVRAAAQRRLQRGFFESTPGIIFAREDRQRREERRQVACVARREAYHNAGIVQRLCAGKTSKHLPEDWMSLLLKHIQ